MNKLCTTCQGLKLSPERFIIADHSSSSAAATQAQNSYLPRQESKFSVKSRAGKNSIGTWKDIYAKSTASPACPFCSLVIKSIVSGEQQSSVGHQEAVCYLNWEVDGREAARGDGRTKGRTRRIHLFWSDQRLKDSYLVFVAPERYLRPNSDAQYVWKNEALFLGRNIRMEGGNQALIKSWLDLCFKSHRGPCLETIECRDDFETMISQSYFGVIDVLDLRLTSLPHSANEGYETKPPRPLPAARDDYEPELLDSSHPKRSYAPFIALSYVWGKGKEPPYMTNLSNIMLHRKHGGLEKCLTELPRALQDAINLVRCLGVRYIWIDSLCIVQDSARSWNLNARAMDLIYGNALLTICAADGLDSSAGLRAMHAAEHAGHQEKEHCAPGVRLMISRSPETGIKSSAWDKRAWTFQERLLSKRCLIFTEGRVYFQCLSTGMSEDIFADRKGAGWSLDLVNAPLQMLRELHRRPLWVYLKCIALYTSRQLTKSKDVLAAFSGITNRLMKTMQAPFIFGLPSSHFDLALLWEPRRSIQRRRPKDDNEKKDYNGLEFPSWSWSGWMGEAVEYKSGMVEGCLTNLQEWLTKHTWICWYIRDGHGNLRPLWDVEKPSHGIKQVPVEQLWEGYGSRGRREPRSIYTMSPKKEDDRRSCRKWSSESSHSDNDADGGYRRYLPREAIMHHKREYYEKPFDLDHGREERDRSPVNVKRDRSFDYGHSKRHGAEARYGEDILEVIQEPGRAPQDPTPSIWLEELDDDDGHCGQNSRQTYDDYGRILPIEVRTKNQKRFTMTLPENPYRVVMTEYTSAPDKEFPDQPILQFWTWSASLHIVAPEGLPAKTENGLCSYDIADDIGDWCGSIVLDEKWLSHTKASQHEFIAISEAKAFTEEECEIWTYYIPKEREQSKWDLYYVLLIEREGYKWQRVALGKVFKAAFSCAEWKEIILG